MYFKITHFFIIPWIAFFFDFVIGSFKFGGRHLGLKWRKCDEYGGKSNIEERHDMSFSSMFCLLTKEVQNGPGILDVLGRK
jgi:hypothetical protein